MFSQLLRSLFVSSLFSDFQHSFLSSPLSANDLASYLTEKRDAIRLERPHPSTINSPAFPYQYTKLCLHFCSKGKKTDEILCPVIRSPLILKTSLLPSPVWLYHSCEPLNMAQGPWQDCHLCRIDGAWRTPLPSSLLGDFSSLPFGLLHKAAQSTASPRIKDPKEREKKRQKPWSFYNPTSEMASHPFGCIWFIKIKLPKSTLRGGHRNRASPLEGRSIREFMDIFVKPSLFKKFKLF